jgi:hypothetical protein
MDIGALYPVELRALKSHRIINLRKISQNKYIKTNQSLKKTPSPLGEGEGGEVFTSQTSFS